jgi:glyoxylase-like metal-dependent hydrolase (beta-lactamase superfamily II)
VTAVSSITIGRVTVLVGADSGRYPDSNSILVRGSLETVLIDPSLSLATVENAPTGVDRLLITHGHEDHLAGVFRYPDVPIQAHVEDLEGVRSLDGLMAIYGLPPDIACSWRKEVVGRFHYVARQDASAFVDGDCWDLGATRLRAVHLPGHTRGHSGFFIEPEGVMLLADVDLSGFGPYYGDAWSSLEDFETTLRRCRDIDAGWYVTFHHKGVIEGRTAFLSALRDYEAVIGRRERALLEYLREPRTLQEMVAHRFVYRSRADWMFVNSVERRSIEQHLARLVSSGAVVELGSGRYQRGAV